MKICKNCSKSFDDDILICPDCGAALEEAEEKQEETAAEAVPEASETAEEASENAQTTPDELLRLIEESKAGQEAADGETAGETKKKKGKAYGIIIGVCLGVLCILVGILGVKIWNTYKNGGDAAVTDYVAKVSKKSGFPFKIFGEAAGKVGDVQIDSALLETAYLIEANSMANQSASYDSNYGPGVGAAITGFDAALPIEEQTTLDENQKEITFAESFRLSANNMIETFVYMYNLGQSNGYELEKADKDNINATVDTFINGEAGLYYDILDYLTENYGEKKATYIITEYLYLLTYTQNASKAVLSDLDDSVNPDDIAEYIKQNENDLLNTDIYLVSKGTSELEDSAKYIKNIKKTVTDKKSFEKMAYSDFGIAEGELDTQCKLSATKDIILSNVSEEAAEWMFSADRKEGDCFVADLSEQGGFYVFCIAKTAYLPTEKLPSIRAIPIYDETEEKTLEEIKALADEAVAEFNSGDKTEESFIALVDKYSSDSSVKNTDGLLENIQRNYYTAGIENWAFDAARAGGDVDIVELEGVGYCVLYYIGAKYTQPELTAIDALTADIAEDLSAKWLEEAKGTLELYDTAATYETGICEWLKRVSEEGTTAAAE